MESVKMEDVLFPAPDVDAEERKADAALRSSSKSETVSNELLPRDLKLETRP